MIRRPPRSTRTDTLLPYTTLFRSDRIGIVGANGAGKSTLLKLLTGEIPPDEGKITLAPTLDGIVIDQQRSLLSPEKTVRDILADGGDWVEEIGRAHV